MIVVVRGGRDRLRRVDSLTACPLYFGKQIEGSYCLFISRESNKQAC